MPTLPVKVKWGKEKFDLTVDTDDVVDVFRAQLFALTQVPPERQNIVLKGKTLKDTWSDFPVVSGANFLLMGTAAEVPQAPTEKTVFAEDLSENQLAKASGLPLGLPNLGNTCYLNATLQCLNAVPDLAPVLARAVAQPLGGLAELPEARLSNSLNGLFTALKARAVPRINAAIVTLVQTLRAVNPRFAEMKEGHYTQQDASEAWTQVIGALQGFLPPTAVDGALLPRTAGQSFVDQLFGVGINTTWSCEENPAEGTQESTERTLQLSCTIDSDTGYMLAGLRRALEGTVIKASPSLGRDATYKRTGLVSRLPGYLVVNFVRFFYKTKDQTSCKIRKDVKFPLALDAVELCAPDLVARLRPARDLYTAYADSLAVARVRGAAAAAAAPAAPAAAQGEAAPYWFPDDVGSSNSGLYDLAAVLTHKGRTADSGHYIAWVRSATGQWLVYDDDAVAPVSQEDVLKLSGAGGADWHTAYILVYGPRFIPKDFKAPEADAAAAPAATAPAAMDTGAD